MSNNWQSPWSAEALKTASCDIFDLTINDTHVYWMRSDSSTGGYPILFRAPISKLEEFFGDTDSIVNNSQPVLEKPIASFMYQYGGLSYCIHDDFLFYVNAKDQNLYRLSLETKEEVQLTNDDSLYCVPTPSKFGLLILEEKIKNKKRLSKICLLKNVYDSVLSDSNVNKITIFSEYKHLGNIAVSEDSSKIAWCCSNNMPWEQSSLFTASLNENGVADITKIVENSHESIVEPIFDTDNNLFVLSDRNNWWNVYQVNGVNSISLVHKDEADYSKPAWQMGKNNYLAVKDKIYANTVKGNTAKLISFEFEKEITNAALKDHENITSTKDNVKKVETLDSLDACHIYELSANDKGIIFAYSSKFNATRLGFYSFNKKQSCNITKTNFNIDKGYISEAKELYIPKNTKENNNENDIRNSIQALFYHPKNKDYQEKTTDNKNPTKPPVILKIHGGPTSQAIGNLDPKIQYWTSRGFALIDVNYTGSTGFGREYRQGLYGHWGQKDVQDCITALEFIVKQGLVDPERIFVRGGSAGGLTMFNILASTNIVSKAASYCGVTDVYELINFGHELEQNYLKDLVCLDKDNLESKCEKISPANIADNITTPVIFFHGDNDTVVPIEQSLQMQAKLEAHGIKTKFVTFEGEGHRLKQDKTIKESLEAELNFYLN